MSEIDVFASDSLSSRVASVGDGRLGRSRSSTAHHIVQRFDDCPPGMTSSSAKFEVVSYFAPQFTKLRARCINGGERSFVMSMCRSRKYFQ